ncbi:hypothetical protein BLA14095_03711 [Burkholderia lata]|uniref:hypothetical protein n=1 Tax=Burkholderia lata (strain ATCC 17760 / DSM 23089 / LMG 22485 / NCIMB 9086 / R18194 / 383) TaxID=482957 RepID=UPI001454B3F4|nr:hypothetical protein [Burkholderia lata]VWB80396.1 hypothetical protein BLA14095_03711 [Burkholderia lata]
MSSFHRADWLALTSPFVTLAIVSGGYYIAYWQERGKARAAIENIDRLTRAVEDIKAENAARLADISHQNAVLIEQLKSQNQLRLAALDRRLQVHQEAFVHWRQLIANAHSEKIGEIVVQCQDWWEQNALYLEPPVRDAFNRAYFAAASHRSFINVEHRNESTAAAVRANWKLIMDLGDIIMEAVALPALNELEQSTQLPKA